jgi:hypothetical protein
MKKRSILLMCLGLTAFGLALSATPSFAQKTVRACQDEWRANKAANQAANVTEKDFVAKCRTEAAKPAAATTTTAPAAAAAAPKTAATTAKKPADPQEAEHARARACAADWKAAKAAGKIAAGATWPSYWSDCDKRKKAAGM